jgi:hypothetical protein
MLNRGWPRVEAEIGGGGGLWTGMSIDLTP